MAFATAKVAIILWKQVVAVGFLCGEMADKFHVAGGTDKANQNDDSQLNSPSLGVLPNWPFSLLRPIVDVYPQQKQGSDETGSFHRCLAMSSYEVKP